MKLWFNRYRMKRGLTWERTYPTLTPSEVIHALVPWLIVAILLLIYVLVGTLDYADAKAGEGIDAELRAELSSKMLVDCLNGVATFVAEDGGQVGCFKAVVNPP